MMALESVRRAIRWALNGAFYVLFAIPLTMVLLLLSDGRRFFAPWIGYFGVLFVQHSILWALDGVFCLIAMPSTIVLLFLSHIAKRQSQRSGNGRAVETGVSLTAQVCCAHRYILYEAGFGPDNAAGRIAQQMPLFWVAWLSGKLMWYRYRLFGRFQIPKVPCTSPIWYLDNTIGLLDVRTKFIDDVYRRYILEYGKEGKRPESPVHTCVVLGAGFDTRGYRLQRPPSLKTWFEVDAPHISKYKQKLLASAGMLSSNDEYKEVRFVPVLFGKQRWVDCLAERGYDRKEHKTFFIMEGVVNYLDEATVKNTFRTMASAPKGSLVVFTVRLVEGEAERKTQQRSLITSVVKTIGEPHKFFLKRGTHEKLLADAGLGVVEYFDLRALIRRYKHPAVEAGPMQAMYAAGGEGYACILATVK